MCFDQYSPSSLSICKEPPGPKEREQLRNSKLRGGRGRRGGPHTVIWLLEPRFLLVISYTHNRYTSVDKLSINPSGLKDQEFSFERQPNAVTPCAHTPVCGQTFTLFHPKKSSGVTIQKRILVSYGWLTHPDWFLFRLSSFLLLVLCCLCNRWMPEGKSSLLPRVLTLQQLAQQAGCKRRLKQCCRPPTGHREVTNQLLETLSCTFIQHQLEHTYTKGISEQSN